MWINNIYKVMHTGRCGYREVGLFQCTCTRFIPSPFFGNLSGKCVCEHHKNWHDWSKILII